MRNAGPDDQAGSRRKRISGSAVARHFGNKCARKVDRMLSAYESACSSRTRLSGYGVGEQGPA